MCEILPADALQSQRLDQMQPLKIRNSPCFLAAPPRWAVRRSRFQGVHCMSMISNLDLIRRVPLFSLLTPEQAQTVAQNVIKRRYRRGEVIVQQGHKSDELILSLTGRARLLPSDPPGGEVILAGFKAGDYGGADELMSQRTHSGTQPTEPHCYGL